MQFFKNLRFVVSNPSILVAAALGFSALYSADISAQMPPPKVEVMVVESSNVRHWEQYSGRISAVERVEIRPLVSGRIDKILFRDSELVERGQPLFVIDPRPYEAAVKEAQAALTTASARARLTKAELQRSKDLLKGKLISQSLFDEAQTADDIAKAAVLQAESQLLNAKLNLEYAHVEAPISGRVGRAELTVGNIVDAGPSAPLLTTIVAEDKVYAEFRLDEQSYLKLRAGAQGNSEMPVSVALADGSQEYKGLLHAFDNQLDTASGTIRARAILNNEQGTLVPGMFADVRIGSATKQAVYLIPERAIGTNQDRKFVYVVDKENLAQYREIQLGTQVKGQRVVMSGLDAGEQVVVKGLVRVRPQSPVEPVIARASEAAVESSEVAVSF